MGFTIDLHIPRNPSLRKEHKSINYRQENAGTSCLMSKTGSDEILCSPLRSASEETPFLRRQLESINYKQKTAGTSCLASKTGSENILGVTIVLATTRNPALRKRRKSINNMQENADTSCLARSDNWGFCPAPLLPSQTDT